MLIPHYYAQNYAGIMWKCYIQWNGLENNLLSVVLVWQWHLALKNKHNEGHKIEFSERPSLLVRIIIKKNLLA